MYKTPDGTSVGVDDPYDHADICDHLTDDGRCRLALSQGDNHPEFATDRREDNYACLAHTYEEKNKITSTGSSDVSSSAEPSIPVSAFRECPHYRSTTAKHACVRCGLEDVRIAHDTDAQSLLEEHHLSYRDNTTQGSGISDTSEGTDETTQNNSESQITYSHEIPVALCRWCHSKVHQSIARLEDDVSPDPEAFATREQRRAREQQELGFSPASEKNND